MDRSRVFLLLCRRLSAVRAKPLESYYDRACRCCYHSPAIEREVTMKSMSIRTPIPFLTPISTRVRMISGSQRQYNSTFGNGDDDESQDARDQKAALLRALKGKKGRYNNREIRQKKATNELSSKKIKLSSNRKSNYNDQGCSVRRNNQSTSMKKISATSKKLTLDEFFANLETAQKNEASSESATQKNRRVGITATSEHRERSRVKLHCKNEDRKSEVEDREAPIADVGSFFDEVNALMQCKETEASSKRNRKLSTNKVYSRASSPTLRASMSEIIPPINTISKKNGVPSRLEMEKALHYSSNPESWDQYCELLDEVIEGPKFLTRFRSKKKNIGEDDIEGTRKIDQIVEWLRSDIPFVDTHLPTLDFTLKGEAADENEKAGADSKKKDGADGVRSRTRGRYTNRSESIRKDLNAQKDRFIDETCWTKMQYDVATGALEALGGLCAKKCMAPPLDIAWSKLKELGYAMNKKDVLHNYLYVSSTFSLPRRRPFTTKENLENSDEISDASVNDGDRGDGESLPSLLDFLKGTAHLSSGVGENDDSKDELDVSAEVALCHDFLHEPTEQSIGIHVRRLVRLGKASEAEKQIEETMKSDDLRLRTYAPIYQAYIDQGDVSSAFKLFVKMKENKNVLLQTETFVQLIACIAENGYFRVESKKISGIEELPYETNCGPGLLDALVSELAEHSIEITSASAKRLYNAFQRGFRGDNPKQNLKQLHLLESLQMNNDVADSDEIIVSRVEIDQSTGRCPRSGVQLRLINLDPMQKLRFQEALVNLVSASYKERHRKGKNVGEKLHRFGRWLQTRDGKPFTAIIDGPNIAYYMQNFQQGTFNFYQIKFVVDALEGMGENVLVVLPKKYTYDRFSITKATQTVKQTLSAEEKAIRNDLIAKGKAYVVPVGSLDDYYWMYASVSMNEEFVPPDNLEGRWPGNRPMLISNDKLRDHKLSLLEPRLFRRWYSNFMVNFTFSAFVNDECIDKEIGFKTADFYSREIQGHHVDKNGTTWHFPVSDWAESECLCIRIPHSRE